jgi:hypothetical protein
VAARHLVAADQQVTVYERPGLPQTAGIYGCAYGHRHSYRLSPPLECEAHGGGCARIHDVVLAGPIVAYAELRLNRQLFGWSVVVRDLRSGRVLHTARSTTTPISRGAGPVEELVVKPDGAVAWIVSGPFEPLSGTGYELHALDRTGSRVLASGPSVDSLALAGSTLYWMQGGKPFSASLD